MNEGKIIKIIDVTLRDGGYRNNFFFPKEIASKIVSELTVAGVDFVEIGYRNGPLNSKKECGITAKTSNEYIKFLKDNTPHAKLSVMMHPRNIVEQDLNDLQRLEVDMLRICLKNNDLDYGLSVLGRAKDLGFLVSANFTHITTLESAELLTALKKAQTAGADIAYLADSNGNMIPDQVLKLFDLLSSSVTLSLGFHAHDNLCLAMANVNAAVSRGATFVDCSLCGMGKGSGNLQLETFVVYLARVKIDNTYNAVKILELADFVAKNVVNSHLPTSTNHRVLGAFNIPFDFEPVIGQVSQIKNLSWHSLAYAIGKEIPKNLDLSHIYELANRLKGE